MGAGGVRALLPPPRARSAQAESLRAAAPLPAAAGVLSSAWITCGSTSAAFFAIPAAVASDTRCETSAISLRASFSPRAPPW